MSGERTFTLEIVSGRAGAGDDWERRCRYESSSHPREIVEGLRHAAEYARVQAAVHEWIRDDVPIGAKMMLGPEHVHKLIDRVTGSVTRVALSSDRE